MPGSTFLKLKWPLPSARDDLLPLPFKCKSVTVARGIVRLFWMLMTLPSTKAGGGSSGMVWAVGAFWAASGAASAEIMRIVLRARAMLARHFLLNHYVANGPR